MNDSDALPAVKRRATGPALSRCLAEGVTVAEERVGERDRGRGRREGKSAKTTPSRRRFSAAAGRHKLQSRQARVPAVAEQVLTACSKRPRQIWPHPPVRPIACEIAWALRLGETALTATRATASSTRVHRDFIDREPTRSVSSARLLCLRAMTPRRCDNQRLGNRCVLEATGIQSGEDRRLKTPSH